MPFRRADPGEYTYRMIVPTLGLRHSVPLPGRFAEPQEDFIIFVAMQKSFSPSMATSSWGTSTVARELAAKVNYLYLDSGAMYGQ